MYVGEACHFFERLLRSRSWRTTNICWSGQNNSNVMLHGSSRSGGLTEYYTIASCIGYGTTSGCKTIMRINANQTSSVDTFYTCRHSPLKPTRESSILPRSYLFLFGDENQKAIFADTLGACSTAYARIKPPFPRAAGRAHQFLTMSAVMPPVLT